GQTLQSLTGIPAIAFVDQSQQSVVHPQDWIEIQTENTRWRYRVTGQDLQQAFAVVSLNKQIQIPNQTRLLQNYPNPFNPETWIPFQLSQDSQVVVSVFGVKGNLVRRLDLGWMIAGNYLEANRAIYWDGKSETGETVASGTYFYQIAAGDYSEIRQMVILK
ncbi:MAG: FlgD immunoglobulin-like domain containing protein, partial [Candidatus Poribacteria bacterium]|nr:FlgD immunoglobulin-like domain containing protein [Candidatus Poribacteria bacterium]